MRSKKEILGEMSSPLFLLRCKSDFKFFAEKCLGFTSTGDPITIYPFQELWVNEAESNKRIIIESGTGSSKTEIMGAMYILWKMFCKSNLRILLVSKTLEQSSSNILFRIKRYIEDNELLSELFIPENHNVTWNASEIITATNVWVKNVPYSTNIRSYRANIIVCDEIDSYEDTNIFFEHVLSRLFPNGQLIGISTPTGPTKIIGQLKEKFKAGLLKGWHFVKTPYLVDEDGNPAVIENREDILKYKSIWPENWSIQKLYERWGEQGKANWMRNYMVESLGEIDDALFPIRYIAAAFDYNRGFNEEVNQEAMYFIAADFAISDGPKADFDAYIVIEKIGDQYIIKLMETHKGWQRPEKVNRLYELYSKFESQMGTYLIVDSSNMGTMVMNDLRNKGIPVIEQKFHTSLRKKIITSLGSVFAGRGIVIPRSPSTQDECVKYSELLKDQLTGFKRKRSEKTGDELIESRAAHDDLAMALAMAIDEAVKHSEMDLTPMTG